MPQTPGAASHVPEAVIEGIAVYELLGRRADDDAALERLARAWDEAMERYFARDWDGALALCERLADLRREDPPRLRLEARCRRYRAAPPPAEWDGVTVMGSG